MLQRLYIHNFKTFQSRLMGVPRIRKLESPPRATRGLRPREAGKCARRRSGPLAKMNFPLTHTFSENRLKNTRYEACSQAVNS